MPLRSHRGAELAFLHRRRAPFYFCPSVLSAHSFARFWRARVRGRWWDGIMDVTGGGDGQRCLLLSAALKPSSPVFQHNLGLLLLFCNSPEQRAAAGLLPTCCQARKTIYYLLYLFSCTERYALQLAPLFAAAFSGYSAGDARRCRLQNEGIYMVAWLVLTFAGTWRKQTGRGISRGCAVPSLAWCRHGTRRRYAARNSISLPICRRRQRPLSTLWFVWLGLFIWSSARKHHLYDGCFAYV